MRYRALLIDLARFIVWSKGTEDSGSESQFATKHCVDLSFSEPESLSILRDPPFWHEDRSPILVCDLPSSNGRRHSRRALEWTLCRTIVFNIFNPESLNQTVQLPTVNAQRSGRLGLVSLLLFEHRYNMGAFNSTEIHMDSIR